MLRVASNFTLALAAGTKMTCADAVKKLLKRKGAWEVRSAGSGSKVERWYARAWLATASPRHGLLIRRLLAAELSRPKPPGHAARWLRWRRRHQARSRWFHKRARLEHNYALVS